MNDLPVHILLFLVVIGTIAYFNAIFADTQEAVAVRSVPRRVLMFVIGCGILALIMLACEHTFARVG